MWERGYRPNSPIRLPIDTQPQAMLQCSAGERALQNDWTPSSANMGQFSLAGKTLPFDLRFYAICQVDRTTETLAVAVHTHAKAAPRVTDVREV